MNTNNVIINNKLTRTTFKDYNGKYWCWRKKIKHPEFDRDILTDYYCYRCKGEFIFFHEQERPYTDNPPFKFHRVLIKELAKKENDWKTNRRTEIYQALCCQCAMNDKSQAGCFCINWIQSDRPFKEERLAETKSKVAQAKEIISVLEIKPTNNEDSYLNYRLNRYLKEEKKELEEHEQELEYLTKKLKALATWEEKLNEIKKAVEFDKRIEETGKVL